jgi:rhodanese-related sulfurtransferase
VKILFVLVSFVVLLSANEPISFDDYLKKFDYAERNAMKIKSYEALELYKAGKAVFVDIRFKEEFAVWNFPFMKSVPLNELPNRLGELDKDRLIITVCPHYDRAEMARLYLVTKGYRSRYLTDGLLGMASHLKGDEAKEFINDTVK